MENILHIIWIIFQSAIALTLIFPVLSFTVYLLIRRKPVLTSSKENDYAVIVTAYKFSANLDNVIRSLLAMQHNNYVIYVVADDCPDYKDSFNDPRVVIIHPEKVLANQVHSHFLAIEKFKRAHAFLTIIDSDNLVAPSYLAGLDIYFNNGYEAVQGVRKAKNLDTHYACIDALNEIYYLFYDRKILFGIGSSSMLSGSGMAFTVDLYMKCMGNSASSGAGFDKILQKEIMSRGFRIAFAPEAVVYDEKTSKGEQLVKQRARWMNTWFRYCRFGYQLIGQGIRHTSMNRLLFGFILTRPPLFLLLLLCFLIMIANIFISLTAVIVWLILFAVFFLGFFLALFFSDTDKRIYRSLVHIPRFVMLQIFSLFRARKANEYSVATEHSFNKEIEKID